MSEERRELIVLRHDGSGMVSWLESWVTPRQITQDIKGREREVIVWECIERVRVVCADGISGCHSRVVGRQPTKFKAIIFLANRRANILRHEKGWSMVVISRGLP